MNAAEALKQMVTAQVQAQLGLGAAIEELAIWVEANGGNVAASQARDALKVLDESSQVMATCLQVVLAGSRNIDR